MPPRLEAAEERVQTLECRVDRLNNDLLNPVQPKVLTSQASLRPTVNIHDKPSEEAVRECREAVGLMLASCWNMKEELTSLEEKMSMRLHDFEAALQAAATANHDAVHDQFAARSHELEALYTRSALCEEGLQHFQRQSSLFSEWKEEASYQLAENLRRLDEVEARVDAIGSGLEELAASRSGPADGTGEEAKANRASSKLSSVLDVDDVQNAQEDPILKSSGTGESKAKRTISKLTSVKSPNFSEEAEAVQAAKEVADKAWGVAKKALMIAEDVRTRMSKGNMSDLPQAPGCWPRRGKIFAPSTGTALQELQLTPASMSKHLCPVHRQQFEPGREVVELQQSSSWDEQSPNHDVPDGDVGKLPSQLAEQTNVMMARVLLQGAQESYGLWHQAPQLEKERFLPPTGGCFRHQSPHSRLSSRNTRPLTAERPQVVQRGGIIRPSTAGPL
ncbi:unnamed protein product [Symbiodinium pilosum]|uniref:Uncharacterized protein n=1 Tax=Symbiodinium pilosum TaxID=2952 RepID=A0A812YGZ5_SYMPI|nr:unnamed protein product [Symbiodinium pilosum]